MTWQHLKSYHDEYWLVTEHTHGDFCNAAPLGDQATSIMIWYPTQSYYPDSEPTNSCCILIMPNAWLGSDTYQFGLIWLGFVIVGWNPVIYWNGWRTLNYFSHPIWSRKKADILCACIYVMHSTLCRYKDGYGSYDRTLCWWRHLWTLSPHLNVDNSINSTILF